MPDPRAQLIVGEGVEVERERPDQVRVPGNIPLGGELQITGRDGLPDEPVAVLGEAAVNASGDGWGETHNCVTDSPAPGGTSCRANCNSVISITSTILTSSPDWL